MRRYEIVFFSSPRATFGEYNAHLKKSLDSKYMTHGKYAPMLMVFSTIRHVATSIAKHYRGITRTHHRAKFHEDGHIRNPRAI